VLRGGSFTNQALNVRASYRNNNVPANRNINNGFRPASTLPCPNSQGESCGVCQGAKSIAVRCRAALRRFGRMIPRPGRSG